MFQFDIKPEDINRAVADAIVQSSFGQQFQRSVNEAITNVLTGWNSPVSRLAQEAVSAKMKELLSTPEMQEKLKTHIGQKLTQDWIDKMFKAAIDKVVKETLDRDEWR